MSQEERELMIKDLCSRLLYNIKAWEDDEYPLFTIIGYDGTDFIDNDGWEHRIGEFKPYLRPLSSMTEEEFEKLKEYSELKYDQLDLASFQNGAYKILDFYLNEVPSGAVIRVFDWLNKYHFDYHDLIQMGLAIEAPEGMYNLNK